MRGKQAALATTRRDREATETELVALRRKNAQLVAELAEASEKLKVANARYQTDIRQLRAERDAAAMPLLQAAERRLADEKAEHQRTRAELKKTRHSWSNAFANLGRHFMSDHSMTALESSEATMALCGITDEHGRPPTTYDVGPVQHQDAEQIRNIQRARGKRRPGQ
jgi:peptidoglycan hydrolase CwlO-like protein